MVYSRFSALPFLVLLQLLASSYGQYPSQGQNLGQSCSTDYECLRFSGNSKCSTSTRQCVCNLGYQVSGRTCVRKYCSTNYDCSTYFANTRCNTDRTCICDYNFFLNADTQTCSGNSLYPNPNYPNPQYPQYPQYPNNQNNYRCTYESDCSRYQLYNARCTGGQCVCTWGYQLIGGRCEPVRCTYDSDCTRFMTGTSCRAGTCDCDYQHSFDSYSNTCVRKYGGWNGGAEGSELNLPLFISIATICVINVLV